MMGVERFGPAEAGRVCAREDGVNCRVGWGGREGGDEEKMGVNKFYVQFLHT